MASSSDYRVTPAAAVDGDTNPAFSAGSCMHTDSTKTKNPWWAVDLKDMVRISRIEITNRDSQPSRLQNFLVGVSLKSPATDYPDVFNFPLCHNFSAIAGAQETITCTLLDWGRYVILQLPGHPKILHFCEFKVFGEIIKTYNPLSLPATVARNDEYMPNHTFLSVPVLSAIGCVAWCQRELNCTSVNYQPGSTGVCFRSTNTTCEGTCELNDIFLQHGVYAEPGWVFIPM